MKPHPHATTGGVPRAFSAAIALAVAALCSGQTERCAGGSSPATLRLLRKPGFTPPWPARGS